MDHRRVALEPGTLIPGPVRGSLTSRLLVIGSAPKIANGSERIGRAEFGPQARREVPLISSGNLDDVEVGISVVVDLGTFVHAAC